MEWIVFGFMGGLGLIVAIIICVAFYQLKWGKARDAANQCIKLKGTKEAPVQPHDHMSHM